MLPLTQGPPRPTSTESLGLRSRKKERTRRAIEDAALDLFAEQGYEATTVDQIAERAEISKATFFRYFSSKGEVVFGAAAEKDREWQQGIVERPTSEDDLTAVVRAMRERWLPTLDPQRTVRRTRAARTSPLLRGLSLDVAMEWQAATSEALAGRRGLDVPDRQCRLVAALSFAVLSNAVNRWVNQGCADDLATTIEEDFALMEECCRAWLRD